MFKTIEADTERKYTVTVSYMEVSLASSFEIITTIFQIYNECVNDLINPANKNLDVRESI